MDDPAFFSRRTFFVAAPNFYSRFCTPFCIFPIIVLTCMLNNKIQISKLVLIFRSRASRQHIDFTYADSHCFHADDYHSAFEKRIELCQHIYPMLLITKMIFGLYSFAFLEFIFQYENVFQHCYVARSRGSYRLADAYFIAAGGAEDDRAYEVYCFK